MGWSVPTGGPSLPPLVPGIPRGVLRQGSLPGGSPRGVSGQPPRTKSRKSIGGAALRVALKGDSERHQLHAPEAMPPPSARKPNLAFSATPRAKTSRASHAFHTPQPSPRGYASLYRCTDHRLGEAVPAENDIHGPGLRNAPDTTLASALGSGVPSYPSLLPAVVVPPRGETKPAWRILEESVPEVHVRDESGLPSVGWRAAREAVFSPASAAPGSSPQVGLGLPSRVERLSSGTPPPRPLAEVLAVLDTLGTDWKVCCYPAVLAVRGCVERVDYCRRGGG